jgi:predicted nucleic acid-binding protein
MLDSSVLIDVERHFMAGDQSALARLPSAALVPSIVVAELWLGVELSTSPPLRQVRTEFLERLVPFVEVAPFDYAAPRSYAALVATLTRTGQRIGDRDAQIAATALAGGHELMTLNVREFRRVPGLRLSPVPES